MELILIYCLACKELQPYEGQGHCLSCNEPISPEEVIRQQQPPNDWVN